MGYLKKSLLGIRAKSKIPNGTKSQKSACIKQFYQIRLVLLIECTYLLIIRIALVDQKTPFVFSYSCGNPHEILRSRKPTESFAITTRIRENERRHLISDKNIGP